jgi:hypothetical protein
MAFLWNSRKVFCPLVNPPTFTAFVVSIPIVRETGDGPRRNDEPSVVFETDEPSVEEVVDARRQHRPVLPLSLI